MPLSPRELVRYSRHFTLAEIGREGQERLAEASVLLVGAGGLGSPMAMYLAAAGVGRIGIVEFDRVDASNLHRQVLFGESDVGRLKIDAAEDRLREINPHITMPRHPVRLDATNAREIVQQYDVVADGSDTFATKYLVNDACVLEGKPNVYGSVLRFQGEVSVFGVEGGPCYRCLYPEPPPPGMMPSCAEAGVLGVLPGLIGTMQATEVIKLLLGIGEPLAGRLIRVEAMEMRFLTLHVERDPECVLCGDRPTQRELLPDYEHFCATITSSQMAVPEITVRELKERMDRGERPYILDVRRQNEYDIANLGGELIPVDELPQRLDEIEEHREDDLVVVHCRTGVRSAKAVEMLRREGFENAVNLKGGTHAWSDEIDPSMPKY